MNEERVLVDVFISVARRIRSWNAWEFYTSITMNRFGAWVDKDWKITRYIEMENKASWERDFYWPQLGD